MSYTDRIINRRPFGWTYTDPAETFHFSFEEIDPFWWHTFVSSNWHFAVYGGIFYICSIFGIQFLMKNREPYNLRKALFLWNAVLGVFSILGFLRFLPGFIFVLSNGLYSSICEKTNTTIPMGFWTLMFVLSKFVELGDTYFIVLRKRKLVLLQWYHHVVTMAAVWILAPYMEPVTRWYVVLNYGVHSLMYPYFAVKALQVRVPTVFANILTTVQFLQMIVGFTVNILSLYYLKDGCFRHPTSIKVFGLVYGSFVILFGKLFYDAVIKRGRVDREKKNE